MYLTLRSACVGVALLLAVGCSSSRSATNYPDAQDFEVGGAGGDAGVDAGVDVIKPLPVSGGDNVLLFGGQVQLLSAGPTCTQEVGATGDRWCAFASPSKTRIGSADLFVINVSKAAAGVSIVCGGSAVDLNCLRLTGGFAENDTHAALFQGDTLVYFDETATPYGWRPGMTNGRVLASAATADVHDCFPASKGTGVVCLRNRADLSTQDVEHADLLAGRLDGTTDPPLTMIDTVISVNTADGNQQHFQNGFPTPAGDLVAWSSRATLTGPEILKVQRIDDPSTLRTVASDVTRWNASPDGSRWYWRTGVNSMTGAGTLLSAPLPGGQTPTTLLTNVVDFAVAPTGGIALVTAAGTLEGIADPVGAPTAITSVDNGVVGIVRVSSQGHVAYAKSFDPILRLIDLHVRKLDGTGMRCTLSSGQDSPIFAPFLPGAGAIIWARFTDLNVPIGDPVPTDGLLTNLSDCKTMTIATGIHNLGAGGDNSVLFSNEGDDVDATLRVRTVAGGAMLGTDVPKLIQTRVDNFASVFPSPGAVLFTVNAQSTSDGVYLHLVAATGQPGTDGGADGATDAAHE